MDTCMPIYRKIIITLLGNALDSLLSVNVTVEGHRYTIELWDASLADDESSGMTPKLVKKKRWKNTVLRNKNLK